MNNSDFKERIARLMGSDGIKHAPKCVVRTPTDCGYNPPRVRCPDHSRKGNVVYVSELREAADEKQAQIKAVQS
jgi:hypothetical protein